MFMDVLRAQSSSQTGFRTSKAVRIFYVLGAKEPLEVRNWLDFLQRTPRALCVFADLLDTFQDHVAVGQNQWDPILG